MEAFDYSLAKVFQPDVQFRMPMYQRPYVWTEEKQWAPLWEDVRSVADRLLAEQDRPTLEGEPEALERTPPHFLGAVVHGDGGGSHAAVNVRLVIDGQQRLTTLQILLITVRLLAERHGDTKTAAQLARLVENHEAVVDAKTDRWKVWPTNVDREPFVGASAPELLPKGTSRFGDARRFFEESVSDWLGDLDEGETVASKVAALGAALQHRVHLVSIELQVNDNAQAIFETLNDRGAPLLAADLVKNYAFQQVKLDPQAVDELYDSCWRPFDLDKKWRTEVRQGRLRRPRIDVFLQHWLSLELGRDVGTSDLFSTFKELHREREISPVELLHSLAKAARVFDRIDQMATADPHSPEGNFVHRWRTVEASTFTPALLCLFEEGVPADQRRHGIAAIESYLVRRMICQATTKQYNLLAVDLAVKLKAAPPGERGAAVEEFLVEQTAPSRVWPADDDVKNAIVGMRYYRVVRADRLVMVLTAIENQLRREAGSEEPLQHGAKLELEHILPDSWKAYWRFADGTTGDLARQLSRDEAKHRLGNLTITSGTINKELRNYPWTRPDAETHHLEPINDLGGLRHSKQEALEGRSVLLINKDLLARAPHRWDEDAITARAQWLAGMVVELWPRPAHPASGVSLVPPPGASTSVSPSSSQAVADIDDEEDEDDASPERWEERKSFADAVATLARGPLVAAGLEPHPPHKRGNYMRIDLGAELGPFTRHHLLARFPRRQAIFNLVVNADASREANIAELESLRVAAERRAGELLPTPPTNWAGGASNAVRAYAQSVLPSGGWSGGNVDQVAAWVVGMATGWAAVLRELLQEPQVDE